MKKILLMLVALVATVTLSAKDGEEMEGWQKSFTPVANADDLAGIHTAVAGDGSCMPAQLTTRHFRLQASPLLTPKVCSLHVLSSMTRMAMRNGLSASLVNVKSMQ